MEGERRLRRKGGEILIVTDKSTGMCVRVRAGVWNTGKIFLEINKCNYQGVVEESLTTLVRSGWVGVSKFFYYGAFC